MQRLDLTDNERAILIAAPRRLVDFDPQTLSPQIQALKAILERLGRRSHNPYPILRAPGKPRGRAYAFAGGKGSRAGSRWIFAKIAFKV
jgi:hypothetical protein